jgi:hypothetical protein
LIRDAFLSAELDYWLLGFTLGDGLDICQVVWVHSCMDEGSKQVQATSALPDTRAIT